MWVSMASSATEALPPLPVQDLFLTFLSVCIIGDTHTGMVFRKYFNNAI